ncbi:MAG: IS1595 family transposase [bacterium]
MASKLLLMLLDEAKCVETIRSMRWPEGVCCPRCNSKRFWIDWEEYPKLQYRCRECKHWWTDLSETIFEGTRLPLSHWLVALDLFRQGKSALAVAQELGVNRHTADRMHRLLQDELWINRPGEKLSGINESDEVYIICGAKGIKQKDRDPRKRGLKKRGRGTAQTDKPPVIGVVERDSGEIRLEVCPNANKETCHEVIEKHVEPGSTLNTDDWGGYNGLEEKGIKHKTVCHSQGEYARDDDGDGANEVHENTMEAIWSLLRQWLRSYRGVRKMYLYLYVNSFEFFHNMKRRVSDVLYSLLQTLLAPHGI